MDDFVRNFLVRMGLTATLEKFETEWYELEATGRLNKEDMGVVPDVYNYNQELNEQCNALRAEVNAQKAVVAKATATWDKFRKERDLHRMHQTHRPGEEQAAGRHQEAQEALRAVRAHHQGAEAQVRARDEGEDADAHREGSIGGADSRHRGGGCEEGEGSRQGGEGAKSRSREGCRGGKSRGGGARGGASICRGDAIGGRA